MASRRKTAGRPNKTTRVETKRQCLKFKSNGERVALATRGVAAASPSPIGDVANHNKKNAEEHGGERKFMIVGARSKIAVESHLQDRLNAGSLAPVQGPNKDGYKRRQSGCFRRHSDDAVQDQPRESVFGGAGFHPAAGVFFCPVVETPGIPVFPAGVGRVGDTGMAGVSRGRENRFRLETYG